MLAATHGRTMSQLTAERPSKPASAAGWLVSAAYLSAGEKDRRPRPRGGDAQRCTPPLGLGGDCSRRRGGGQGRDRRLFFFGSSRTKRSITSDGRRGKRGPPFLTSLLERRRLAGGDGLAPAGFTRRLRARRRRRVRDGRPGQRRRLFHLR